MAFLKNLYDSPLKLGVMVAITVSIGGMVEILPLFFLKNAVPALEGVKPLPALALEGRDLYVKEGCYTCHTQQVRPFRTETERFGQYSLAGESVYDRPFQWGSKRTGPDLARLGGKYPDSWHVQHMRDPRSMVPESVMPSYPWLEKTALKTDGIQAKMKGLRMLGEPYTDAEIAAAPAALEGKTELDALIAYLQGLGSAVKR
ncbi:cytochrome-c oxidase, cbb3-type subunit II [bacterium]|nr:cytochrome-c oxidase, cbb3-type subunit II [bacterium]